MLVSSPSLHVCDDPQRGPNPSPLTRTVALIKTHALPQRLDIETRLVEAGCEIVKERPMEFDYETDPEAFDELFGDEAHLLADGPVWVYILERRRAVQVLMALLPALDDALIVSKSDAQAELQIATLFVSSPPFTSTELPPVAPDLSDFDRGSIRSVNSAVLEALQLGLEVDLPPLSTTRSPDPRIPALVDVRPTLSERSSNASAKTPFRARPLPKTHLAPSITPRLTKAALLRQGLALDGITKLTPSRTSLGTASTGRIPVPRKDKENDEAEKQRAKERSRRSFAGVPGHKRAESINVPSTAPPVIAPRLTKAAALRLGREHPATPAGKKRPSVSTPQAKTGAQGNDRGGIKSRSPATPSSHGRSPEEGGDGEETETEGQPRKSIFEGVPGHKRRESISVTSTTRPPSIVPRTNRSAALRKEGAPPPSSFMFRLPTAPNTPGSGVYSRSSSTLSAYRDSHSRMSTGKGYASATPSRASSRISHVAPPLLTKSTGCASHTSSNSSGTGPRSTSSMTSPNGSQANDGDSTTSSPPAKPTRRLSSLQAPARPPRVNKSAMLRAKKAADDAAKPKSPYANASKR